LNKPIKWRLEIEHLMACNCNWGCPCSFNSPPTYGTCESAEAYRVVKGHYGNTSLAGLKWILAAAWPGPLHEKNGRGVVYLDQRATGAQRPALESIAIGQAGGPIGIFMSTIDAGLEIHTARIEFKFAGKHSLFRAGEAVEVTFEPIRNPVTAKEHHASIALPSGMISKREDHFSCKTFRVQADGLRYSFAGRTAIAMRGHWRGP